MSKILETISLLFLSIVGLWLGFVVSLFLILIVGSVFFVSTITIVLLIGLIIINETKSKPRLRVWLRAVTGGGLCGVILQVIYIGIGGWVLFGS